jgi:hypothetical protein
MRSGQNHFASVARDDGGDLVAVRRHDDAIRDPNLRHALIDADDERKTGEKSEGLSGEARCAQSGWDDGERPHTGRSVREGYVSARTAAKITF